MADIFNHPLLRSILEKNPITMIDIGASGDFPERFKKAKGLLKVLGFEPDVRAFRKLQSTESIVYINEALADSDRDIKFFLTRKQECSSFYQPNHDFLKQFPDAQRLDVVGEISFHAKQLTMELLTRHGVEDPDFIKLDAQGFELDILRGASAIIDNLIFGIEVEVEFAQLYNNQPLFSDVDIFLRKKGFSLFDLKKYYFKRKAGINSGIDKGQLIFADALYFKTYEALMDVMMNQKNDYKKAKIMKAISLCQIYGISDYALYLCEKATDDKLFKLSESMLLYKAIYKKGFVMSFKGKGRLAKLLYRPFKYLNSTKYYFTDVELGNE
ncbi:MAG: FkbM family methyltransferase [Pseudomonadota bacterium]